MRAIRWLMLLLVWSVPVVQAADDARQRPNVLFILTDDQRWDAAGIAGHPFLKTPGIDRLGRKRACIFATPSAPRPCVLPAGPAS